MEAPTKELTASEALFAFVSWVSDMQPDDPVTAKGIMLATLLYRFMRANGIENPEAGYLDKFVLPEIGQ